MSTLRDREAKNYARIPVPGPMPCKACEVKPDHFHKDGCDMEPCPRCSDQLLSCDCVFVEPSYQVFDDHNEVNPFEEACKFASDKDVISICVCERSWITKKVLAVTVFYWR